MASRLERESMDAWFPVVLKWTGLIGTIVLLLVWMVTATIFSPAIPPPTVFLAAFGTMAGLGQGSAAVRDVGGDKGQGSDQ